MVLDQDEHEGPKQAARAAPSHLTTHVADPSQASSAEKGLINKNVQSTSFKLLQMALEAGGEAPDLSRPEGGRSPVPPRSPAMVRAPRIKEPGQQCTAV